MQKRSSVRKWAFWTGVIGLVLAWNNLLNAGVDSCPLVRSGYSVFLCHEWTEMVIFPAVFAGLGALAAWARNRYIV
jgi:hypothetical protein